MNIAAVLGIVTAFFVGSFVGHTISNDQTVPAEQVSQRIAELQDEIAMPLADDFLSMRPAITALASGTVTPDEQNGLLLMREEEKLARDVYATLYETWNVRIFSNIAQSEQTHTEAVRLVLVKYGITDPVKEDTVGVFTSPTMQQLYDDLVAEGSKSLVSALQVGLTVEDLDINDLQDLIDATDNADIKLVYENLQRGSRNHLRSFVSMLNQQGATYTPQYISETTYEAIVSSDRETGSGNRTKQGTGTATSANQNQEQDQGMGGGMMGRGWGGGNR